MKIGLALRLSREDNTYNAGETIEGNICLEIPQELKLKGLSVRLYGYGRVCWDEKRAYTKGAAGSVEMKNIEVYLDQSISLLKRAAVVGKRSSSCSSSSYPAVSDSSPARRRASRARPSIIDFLTTTATDDDEPVVVPPGTYKYPFDFVLPSSLPASFQGRWGQISYSARLALERHGWMGLGDDIEREQEFHVRACYDLNEEPELVRPIGAAADFQPLRLCCRRGQVSVEMRLRRRGYSAGEQIPFWLEVSNCSSRTLFDTKLALLQHVTFRVGAKVKRVTNTLSQLSKGEILPGRTEVWDGEHVDVPQGIVCSTIPTSLNKVLSVKYTVTFSLLYSTWSAPFTLPVTVVMGSVGLKASTIVTYLQLLGITGSTSNLSSSSNKSSRGSKDVGGKEAGDRDSKGTGGDGDH